jgi:hypothetical protein
MSMIAAAWSVRSFQTSIANPVGDVCLANGDPVVQSDKPIEPTGRFAILLGEIDGGNPALTPVCDEARSTADPGARIEHFGLTCDADQVHQLGCGNAAHRVEVLEQPKILGRKMAEVLSRSINCCALLSTTSV